MSDPISTSPPQKVWFLTGASTGFGRQLTEQLLADGAHVVATARHPDKLRDLTPRYPATLQVLTLDVTRQKTVDGAIADVLAHFGRIDVLVNNAGYGMAGAIEETREEEFLPMFETNVFGLVRVTQAVLPQLRKQRSGHIVNFSSIGGLVASPGFGFYNATKFAVEGFSEALAQEVAPLGIKVTIVEPGPFRTDFLGRSGVTARDVIPDYEPTSGKMRTYFHEQDGKQKGDPVRGARAIIDAVNSPNPPLHLLLGASTIDRLRGKLNALNADVDTWAETTRGADFPETPETAR
jgi:NAD(P)-dependent dehydrogenase (short-subunit alcohol dehydrogenase family)